MVSVLVFWVSILEVWDWLEIGIGVGSYLCCALDVLDVAADEAGAVVCVCVGRHCVCVCVYVRVWTRRYCVVLWLRCMFFYSENGVVRS